MVAMTRLVPGRCLAEKNCVWTPCCPSLREGDNAIFFDSGTSRMSHLEVRVADSAGCCILPDILPKVFLNDVHNLSLSLLHYTNNFGELLAAYLAMQCAIKLGMTKVCGDSAITIFFWLCDIIEKRKVAPHTYTLARSASKLYRHFVSVGGPVLYVPRHLNTADISLCLL